MVINRRMRTGAPQRGQHLIRGVWLGLRCVRKNLRTRDPATSSLAVSKMGYEGEGREGEKRVREDESTIDYFPEMAQSQESYVQDSGVQIVVIQGGANLCRYLELGVPFRFPVRVGEMASDRGGT